MAPSSPERDSTPLQAPVLLGRYQPTRLLARGSSSSVFRATDQLLSRDVAVKVFGAGDANALARFNDEVRVLANLSHHGIVSITDAGIDDSSPEDPRPVLVMEFVSGRTLREVIASEILTAQEVGEMVFEIAEALEYVHAQGVVHRDVGPSNIMMVDYGAGGSRVRAQLTDFGIAVGAGHRRADGGFTMGTPAYLSPEQASGGVVGTASDIYSLGLVLLECFTREVAFPGEAVESAMARLNEDPVIPAAVPAVWTDLIRSMTARNPDDRPTALQLTVDVRGALRETR